MVRADQMLAVFLFSCLSVNSCWCACVCKGGVLQLRSVKSDLKCSDYIIVFVHVYV